MPKNKTIVLVVDKEPLTYKILDIILDKEEFEIVDCQTGKRAVQICISIKPNIILIDLDLPDTEGHNIIKTVHEWSPVPFIIVSARSANEDVIEGLEMGAVDYVIKPFNADVLRARINASLRTYVKHKSGVSELSNGPLRIDLMRHEVFLGEELIHLTPMEYNLLRFFMIHRGKMLGHRKILHEVWGSAHSDSTHYLRVFIKQLRNKIEINPAQTAILTTELGIGYRMEVLNDLKQGELML